jgi:hypothetical protein
LLKAQCNFGVPKNGGEFLDQLGDFATPFEREA